MTMLHSKLRSINIAQNQLTTEQMSREDIRTRASIPNVRPVRLVRRTPPLPIARHLQSGKVSPWLDETIFYYLFHNFHLFGVYQSVFFTMETHSSVLLQQS